MQTVGIDLSGDPRNPTGWALLHDGIFEVKELYEDSEILFETVSAKPKLVAIDAPLTLPKKGFMRVADRVMRWRGYQVFPPLLKGMKMLTERAKNLAKTLEEMKITVIEVHPLSTRKALRMSLRNLRRIQKEFLKMGFSGKFQRKKLTSHEIDAMTAALTAYLHLRGMTESIGNANEGFIIIPVRKPWWKIQLSAISLSKL
jgi:predicted nuclease with RNAse H fold